MNLAQCLKLFKPAPYQPLIEDKAEVQAAYKYWRIRIFYAMYIGYVFFYFSRKSFTFAMPAMIHELHFTKSDLGILSTLLYVTYGVSKFVSGVLSDRANPRYFMAVGLILTGIFNICFGLGESIWWFALFWGLNGLLQGWGWPPMTKLLTHWYAKSERGTWWSICGTSHNVGGALIPIVAAYCAQNIGWQYAMYLPGLMSIGVGIWLLNRLRDVPQSLGLPPIEVYKNEVSEISTATQEEGVLSIKQILFEQVLNNRFVWLLAISYFFVYVVRTAVNDWTVLYLVEEKGYQETMAAGSVAFFEAGGFVGMLAGGWGTDVLFKGKRVTYMMLCGIGMALSVWGLWATPDGLIWADYLFMGLIGFFVFGPHMLVGLASAEMVCKKAACTANGFAGCWAYIGAAVTGYPLGVLIDHSWDSYHLMLVLCGVATFIVLIPMLNARMLQTPVAQRA